MKWNKTFSSKLNISKATGYCLAEFIPSLNRVFGTKHLLKGERSPVPIDKITTGKYHE